DYPGIESFGIRQEFAFPAVYAKRSSLLKAQTRLAENQEVVTQNQLQYRIRLAWYRWQNAQDKLQLYQRLNRLYSKFYKAAQLRYQTGETNKLAFTAAKSKLAEIQLQQEEMQTERDLLKSKLKGLMATPAPIKLHYLKREKMDFPMANPDSSAIEKNSLLTYRQQAISVSEADVQLAKSHLWP